MRVSLILLASASAVATLTTGFASAADPVTSAASPHAPHAPHAAAAAGRTGIVAETMVGGGYRYVLLDTGTEKVWIAGPEAPDIAVGRTVVSTAGTLMSNFQSKTLGRTFDRIWFVSSLEAQAIPDGAAHVTVDREKVDGVLAAPGGLTVAAVYERSASLAGQQVAVRGRVVRFTPDVQRRNWLHLQDGTGAEASGTHDLTVTTDETAEVGDTVLVRGVLAVERDYGYGYHYAVVIESATITRE